LEGARVGHARRRHLPDHGCCK